MKIKIQKLLLIAGIMAVLLLSAAWTNIGQSGEPENPVLAEHAHHDGFDLTQLDLSRPQPSVPSFAGHNVHEMQNATSVFSSCDGKETAHNPAECSNYVYAGYHYGKQDIPYYIDSSVQNAEDDLDSYIIDAAAAWSSAYMHDGTGQLINLYQVFADPVTEIPPTSMYGRPVCTISYKGNNRPPEAEGFAGMYWAGSLGDATAPRIEIYNDGVNPGTVTHEFGHLLGLGDMDTKGSLNPHGVLMGYGSADDLHYQDIQGAALFNLAHTRHIFTRYINKNDGSARPYRHLCLFCDGYEDAATPKANSGLMVQNCTSHSYTPIVSTADKHWEKCTQCYHVKATGHSNGGSGCACSRYYHGLDYTPITDTQGNTYAYSVSNNVNRLKPTVKIWSTYNGLPVTEIVPQGFLNCTGLEEVVFESGSMLSDIGWSAFAGCTGLKRIAIPQSVITVGDSAFAVCTNLENLTLPFVGNILNGIANTHFGYIFGAPDRYPQGYVPASLKTVSVIKGNISSFAFADCANITSVTLLGGVTGIGNNAFGGCSGLVKMDMRAAGSLTRIEREAFYNSGLQEVYFPESGGTLEYIGTSVFGVCNSLAEINNLPFTGDGTGDITHFGYLFGVTNYIMQGLSIPSSLKTVHVLHNIEDYAFYGCNGIKNIQLSGNATTIGSLAFYGCGELTGIDLNNVTTIGSLAFYGCTGLTELEIPNSVTEIGENAFAGCNPDLSVKWHYNASLTAAEFKQYLTEVVFPYGGSIGEGAFSGCIKLESIRIDSMTDSIGANAFKDCTALRTVFLSSYIQTVGSHAFSGCISLTDIDFGEYGQLESIGASAFNGCTALQTVTVPQSVMSIGASAFNGCTNLETVEIERESASGITTLGNNAFNSCPALIAIVVPTDSFVSYRTAANGTAYQSLIIAPAENLSYTLVDNSYYTVAKGTANTNGTVYIPAAYDGLPVKGVATSGFKNCSGLTQVIFGGENLTTIGDAAFSECRNLTTIALPDSVTTLGKWAFENCTSLTNLSLPDGLTSVGDWAFDNIGSLRNAPNNTLVCVDNWVIRYKGTINDAVTIPDGIVGIGPRAFENQTGLDGIIFPESVRYIGERAFQNVGITTLMLPEGVTRLSDRSFQKGASLTFVSLPQSLESMGSFVFNECFALETVYIWRPVSMGLTTAGSPIFPTNGALVTIGAPDYQSVLAYRTAPSWKTYASKIMFYV